MEWRSSMIKRSWDTERFPILLAEFSSLTSRDPTRSLKSSHLLLFTMNGNAASLRVIRLHGFNLDIGHPCKAYEERLASFQRLMILRLLSQSSCRCALLGHSFVSFQRCSNRNLELALMTPRCIMIRVGAALHPCCVLCLSMTCGAAEEAG